jgi:hypothetical protein
MLRQKSANAGILHLMLLLLLTLNACCFSAQVTVTS